MVILTRTVRRYGTAQNFHAPIWPAESPIMIDSPRAWQLTLKAFESAEYGAGRRAGGVACASRNYSASSTIANTAARGSSVSEGQAATTRARSGSTDGGRIAGASWTLS